MEQWGKDHWSTFAYLETCAVDGHGIIQNAHMRCHARLHRPFVHLGFGGVPNDGSKYPTLLKDGVEVQRHDDWSCLEDMVAAGLLRSWFQMRSGEYFGHGVAKIELTPLAWDIAGQLRTYRGEGGNYATFTPTLPPEIEAVEQSTVVE
jgi:hypothetical protein